jgi:exodeoxyribonuclease V alpha subunit
MYDVKGIGFLTADEIALQLGFDEKHPYRIKACLIYVLTKEIYDNGHTYVEMSNLYKFLRQYIDLTFEEYTLYLAEIREEKRIVTDGVKCYTNKLYEAEKYIADYLTGFVCKQEVDETKYMNYLVELEEKDGFEYGDKQREALKVFFENSCMIVTGGPGTGKTTVTNMLINICEKMFPNDYIQLAAPTGRAAKRLADITGREAVTIHRLLQWEPEKDKFHFNKFNPIEADILVIDEASMIDCELLYSLLQAGKYLKKILFIGDSNQLPSVGPGACLKDMINANIPLVVLDKIWRQEEHSGIVNISFDILNDRFSPRIFNDYKDIYAKEVNSSNMEKTILEILEKAKTNGYGIHGMQILCPMYKGNSGIDKINQIAQKFYNPPGEHKPEWEQDGSVYRVGDKVLQLKNNLKENVFNGSIGFVIDITKIDGIRHIVIDFDGQPVTYDAEEMQNITHGYCISIHKSQGSEFRAVILILTNDHRPMLKRKLVYTAISRAKEKLIVLGNAIAFKKAVNNKTEDNRNTSLRERIESCKLQPSYIEPAKAIEEWLAT